MKKYFIVVFILIASSIYKVERDDELYSCEEICNWIIDENIYDNYQMDQSSFNQT